ncbi:transglycosylase domain-containing protein [bacterium]|nr:transglycosylase domain-containing protein [bacterium]
MFCIFIYRQDSASIGNMRKRKIALKQRLKDWFIDLMVFGFVFGLIVAGILFLWISSLEIPDLSSFEERRVLQSTKIFDRTGETLLYDLHQDVKRTIVSYEDMSRHIKNATVAIEDDTFFEHWGVRPFAIILAGLENLRGGNLLGGRGGSTITQQVIKNSVLEREKTLTRKIKEAILSVRLEQVLTKEEILTHYLNESPYGGTIYGVEEASMAFFGKKARDVTLSEAVYLAALPQAPTYFSPYGLHRDDLDARKNRVLLRMFELGFITEEEYQAAQLETVEFRPQVATGIRAPHFVFYVRDYLTRKYGDESLAERGFRVITSLDWELQEAAEKIVLEKALYNTETFDAENGALVAMDPKNGDVLVMVGSRNYFDDEIDGNFNIAIAERQPGSAFKPFVYASALTEGYTPDTVVFDLETQFSTVCAPDNFTSENECYSPVNYDGKFRGPVTLRNALAQSLNVPAVKTLYLTGLDDALKLARDLGITTLTNKDQYGLTLVLGGGEVRLLEMVGAYGVFANEGVKSEVRGILRIEDSYGNIIEDFSESSHHVLDREVALNISSILSDNVARTPLYGANSLLYFPGRDVAAKTGTTNDYRDAWIVGYTPNLVVGAWAGNNDNTSMAKKISGLIITPMWREFMDIALEKREQETFGEPQATPENIKPVLKGVWFDPTELLEIDTNTEDGEELPELNLLNTITTAHSILYYVDKDDPRGPTPVNPARDPQFSLWEYGVSLWKAKILNLDDEDKDSSSDDEES